MGVWYDYYYYKQNSDSQIFRQAVSQMLHLNSLKQIHVMLKP